MTKASRRRFSALFNRPHSPMPCNYRAALAESALASACVRRCHSDDIHIPRPILRVLCYSTVLSSAAAMETSRYDDTSSPPCCCGSPDPKPQRAMKARDHSIDWLLSNHRCYADVTWRLPLMILEPQHAHVRLMPDCVTASGRENFGRCSGCEKVTDGSAAPSLSKAELTGNTRCRPPERFLSSTWSLGCCASRLLGSHVTTKRDEVQEHHAH